MKTETCLQLVLVLLPVGFAGNKEHKFLEAPDGKKMMNYLHAEAVCKQLGTGWSLPDGHTFLYNLTMKMRDESFSSVWIKIVLKRLSQWQWMDGNPNSEWTTDNVESNEGCAVFQPTEDGSNISPHKCSDNTVGYICEIKDATKCPSSSLCFATSDKTYLIGCNFVNWYVAREKCHSLGGSLAVLRATYIRKELSKTLAKQAACNMRVSRFFIGLNIEDWVTDDKDLKAPSSRKWFEGEPLNAKSECVILSAEDKSFGWRAKNCYESANVICLYEDLDDKKTTVHRTFICKGSCAHQEKTIKDMTVTFPIVGVFLFLLALIGFSIAIKIGRNTRKKPTKTPEKEGPEEINFKPLINKSLSRGQPQATS